VTHILKLYQKNFAGEGNMRFIPWIIGILWIAIGILNILFPNGMRSFNQKLFTNLHPRIISIVILIFGILLIVFSFKSKVFLYPFLLGLLGCIKSAFFFAKPSLAKRLIWGWVNTREKFYQLMGLISFTLGIFLLLCIR